MLRNCFLCNVAGKYDDECRKIPEKKEGQSLSCVIHIYFIYLFYMLRPKNRNTFLKINVEGQ